jgi:hypothetical protein
MGAPDFLAYWTIEERLETSCRIWPGATIGFAGRGDRRRQALAEANARFGVVVRITANGWR